MGIVYYLFIFLFFYSKYLVGDLVKICKMYFHQIFIFVGSSSFGSAGKFYTFAHLKRRLVGGL